MAAFKVKPRLITKPGQKTFTKTPNEPKKSNLSYDCSWKKCTDTFSSALDLDNHLQEHLKTDIKKAPYTCQWQSCSFNCKNLGQFRRHVFYHGYHSALVAFGRDACETSKIPDCARKEDKDIIPALDYDFECQWLSCKRVFESIVQFQDHVIQHSNFDYDLSKTPEESQPKAICNWRFCKKTFTNKYRLVEHTRMHSNQKLFGCPQCGELFRTRTTLFDHCRRQEVNNTYKYQCGQCFKFYPTEKLLRNHVVAHVNCFKCSMCDMTCNSAGALATHVRYRHLKVRPISCPECDHKCVTKADLERHKNFIHRNRLQRCSEPGCNYSVKTNESLRRHYLEVHANSPFIYLCHCCEKLFKYGHLLSKHLIGKHNFQLPSGHKRFIYRLDESGFYRLETTRIESLEVTKQVLAPPSKEMIEMNDIVCGEEIISMVHSDNESVEYDGSLEALENVLSNLD